MKLFELKDFYLQQKNSRDIETPLGKVNFNLKIGKTSLSMINTSCSYKDSSDNYLTGWYTNNFDAELLICRPSFTLPPGMEVENCLAAVWRILPFKQEKNCIFSAQWHEGYTWKDGGPDSGESLDAQTWYNDEYEISIGTQDGEMLKARSQLNDMMPTAFNDNIDPLALIKYTKRGLFVPIDNIFSNKICQVHFVVSWNRRKADDVSTWYAVDLNSTEILGGLLD